MTRPLLLAFALAACTHGGGKTESAASSRPVASAPAGGTPARGMAGMCPMDVPGTTVSAEDTATGVAVTFKTTADQAAALRERVHAMADMHNSHHAGDASAGMAGGGRPGMPPPSRAAVEDLPDGARIQVTPNDPADLARLQSTVRTHAAEMQQHGCGMMGHGPHGP